jgi:small subunit ribosomal protein S21
MKTTVPARILLCRRPVPDPGGHVDSSGGPWYDISDGYRSKRSISSRLTITITRWREVIKLATVTLRSGESQEQLVKRFRKKIQNERVLSDVKKKRFFMSNSEKRRLALRKAKRRERRREWKQQERRRRFG